MSVVREAPVVEATRTHVADRITPVEVDSLPLNGRNYLDLALLAPNVSRTNTRSSERFAETSAVPGTGISVAGQRNLGNTFIVDGLSANDDAADLAGTYYGEEVIREFQVITSGGGAEFGRASAGVINLSAPVNDPVGPAMTIAGVATFGTSTSSPTARDLDVVQVADTVTLQRRSHLVKAGADLLFNRATIQFPGALQGAYAFSSLSALQRGQYVQFQQAFGRSDITQSNPNAGVFVQDEWRPRNDLTVTSGLRYDLQWLPDPVSLDANNVSPRVGAAWAPGGGNTVFRASAGAYFDRIPLRAMSNALQRDGVNYTIAVLSFGQLAAPPFPSLLPALPGGLFTAITTIDPNIQNGRSEQMSFQVERAVGGKAAATVGYSRLRGHGIIMSRNINVPTLTAAEAAALGVPNLGRPDPRFGNVTQDQSIGDSWFNGFTAAFATRNTTWGSARVSYTLARAEDDAGNAFFSAPQDNFDVMADKGPSDNDQRHRVVVSGTVGGTNGSKPRLAGFQFGGVFAFATGVPFNVVTGTDRNNDTTVNDRPAGVGRNSERLPASATLDLRLTRGFNVGGRHDIDVIVEAFNVLNHVNVLNVNNTFGAGATPLPAFGQPTLAGDPRQIQLGVRWSF